jgi:hypothetical protein
MILPPRPKSIHRVLKKMNHPQLADHIPADKLLIVE